MDRKTKAELMAQLERDAQRICSRFGVRYRALEPERANVKRRYGVCYSDGTIRIRLFHVTTRRPLKYSSLVSTLCHELAHLRHFNHGPAFQTFYAQILEWSRREGIYRPGSTDPAVDASTSRGWPLVADAFPRAQARAAVSAVANAANAVASEETVPQRAGPRQRVLPVSGQLDLFG